MSSLNHQRVSANDVGRHCVTVALYFGGQLLRGPGLLGTPCASIAMAMMAFVTTTVALRPQTVTVK